MERRLVLFDVDGTLVDTAGAGRHAAARAFETLFGVDGAVERARSVRFAGCTDPTIFGAVANEIGIDPREWDARWPEFERTYLIELEREMARPDERRRIVVGADSLLRELAARPGVVLGLVTGNLEAGAWTKLRPFALDRYFQGGGFGSEGPVRDRRDR